MFKKLSHEDKMKYGLSTGSSCNLEVGEVEEMGRSVNSRCATEKVSCLVAYFGKEQKEAIRACGFGSFLDIKNRSVNGGLLSYLMENVDPIEGKINMNDKTYMLTTEMFEHVMQLRDGNARLDLKTAASSLQRENVGHCHNCEIRGEIKKLNEKIDKIMANMSVGYSESKAFINEFGIVLGEVVAKEMLVVKKDIIREVRKMIVAKGSIELMILAEEPKCADVEGDKEKLEEIDTFTNTNPHRGEIF
ncbi:hypothetical protein PanWU01x14_338880 [Parasponia andersonii]|uniref:Uncharacterized protein n=1 Tax=Parasponia andersonii TaxID=3476 RepID=A0A2P5AEZ0_PARAD|nr:hypothetical protein PanWU01x14_338880 [Parasponia andersonii]